MPSPSKSPANRSAKSAASTSSAELRLPLAVADDRLDHADPTRVDLVVALAQLVAATRLVPELQPDRPLVGDVGVRDLQVDQPKQLLARLGERDQLGAVAGVRALGRVLQRGVEDVDLGGEVVVHGSGAGAGPCGDVGDPGGGVATLDDDGDGGVQDRPAPVFLYGVRHSWQRYLTDASVVGQSMT